MDALFLVAVYLVIAAIIQLIGFGISEAVNYEFPTAGLLTFLGLFLSAFFLAWPIAVRVFDRLWGDRPRRGEDEAQRNARMAGKPLDYQASLDRRK